MGRWAVSVRRAVGCVVSRAELRRCPPNVAGRADGQQHYQESEDVSPGPNTRRLFQYTVQRRQSGRSVRAQ